MDIQALRRANLRRMIQERGGVSSVAKALGYKSGMSYLSSLLSGRKRFGEEAARKIERRLHLPLNTLDAKPGEPPPFNNRPEADRELLAQLAGALYDEARRRGADVSDEKYRAIFRLAADHALDRGRVDPEYIRNLFDLIK